MLALLAAFTVFRPPSTPGPLARDFEAYYAAGRTLNAGGDPYSRAIWNAESHVPGVGATRDEVLPFVGPAAFLPLWSTLARWPYLVALGIWTALLLGAVLTVVLSALRLGGGARDPLRLVIALGFTLTAAPTIGALALGQAALLAAAALAAAIVAYQARSVSRALLATLLSAIQPNLAFALVARVRSKRDIAIAGAAALTFSALTLGFGGGVTGFFAYLARLQAHGAAERSIVIQYTPAAIVSALGAAPHWASFVGAAVAVAAIAAGVWLVIAQRLDPTTATLVACALLPLAVPFFHEQDFVVEVLPLLVLALRAHGKIRVYAAIAAVLLLVDWFGFAQRQLAAGQILALGFALSCAFIALEPHLNGRRNRAAVFAGRRNRAAVFAGPVTLVLLAAGAIPLGHAHPAPTWPDALPAHFRAAAAADVSSVWGAEQRAAGLASVNPVSSVLRLVPLTGCIVLTVALVGDFRQRRRRRSIPVRATLPTHHDSTPLPA